MVIFMYKVLVTLLFISCSVFSASSEYQQKDRKIQQTASKFDESNVHIIDIGFFYTADLLNDITLEELHRYVERQINAANVVLENSDLPIRRRASLIAPYMVENDPQMEIQQFVYTVYEQEAEPLHKLRVQYGLDYITLLRPHLQQSYCGWALYDSPYAVMELGDDCQSDTLGAHEWGHNDGADHDIINSSSTPLMEKGHGYNCAGDGTVMSTSNNWYTRHDFYSSPNIRVNNEPCGDSENADVVAMLMELKEDPERLGNRVDKLATLGDVSFSLDKNAFNEGQEITITLSLKPNDGQLTQETSIMLVSKSDTATADLDYEMYGKRIEFVAGETEKKVRLEIFEDDYQEAKEQFYLSLQYPNRLKIVTPPKQVTINENVDGTTFRFQTNDISLFEGEKRTITVIREGDLKKSETIQLVNFNPWLKLNHEILMFEPGEAQKEIVFHNTHQGEVVSGEVYIAAIESSHHYDNIRVSTKEKQKNSSAIRIWLLLLVSVVFTRRFFKDA